jgi:CAAX prenyl protease-like protein
MPKSPHSPRRTRFPSIAFIAPFLVFVGFIGASALFRPNPAVEYPARTVVVSLIIVFLSRDCLRWRASRPLESTVIGVMVFFIWILPEIVWPHYRDWWPFKNSIIGAAESSLPLPVRSDGLFLACRVFGTAVVVPIVEELFWRGWLMRYLIDEDFRSVPLGSYSALSFWLTAVLFASEHGPFWDVGLIAGIAYNWWMMRTGNLFDCILAHAVTNAGLAAYVLIFQQWKYWL